MLNLTDLNLEVRLLMAEEIESDCSREVNYVSKRLTEEGKKKFPELLIQAANEHDSAWLASELNRLGLIKTHETRRTRGGTSTVKVPITAAETLAEGEFNLYFVRALCKYAIEQGNSEVEVYRAKRVSVPRSSSTQLLGSRLDPQQLLKHIESEGLNAILPQGPNSGLSVRLVNS